MLISRRGLTAAGLALAAVGAVGVTSTLTAGAAQIAGPRTATVTSAPDPAFMTPPPPLPGTAAAGTNSTGARSVSAGRSISAAGEGGPAAGDPTPAYAPKGLPGRIPAAAGKTVSRSGGPVQSPAAPSHGPAYFYAQASQKDVDVEGTYAMLTIGKPTVGKGVFHSLAEIAVQSEDGKQAVEVGWTVDPGRHGDNEPHLFVYHWIDGNITCYDTCGYVPRDLLQPTKPDPTSGPTTPAIRPGAPLPVGEAKLFGIRNFKGGWWINYNGDWIGYFPNSLWQGRFTSAKLVQWWGEVAASSADKPCAEMGTGAAASEIGAAQIRRINFFDKPAVDEATAVNIRSGTRGAFYSVKEVGKNAIRFGGKGPCPA